MFNFYVLLLLSEIGNMDIKEFNYSSVKIVLLSELILEDISYCLYAVVNNYLDS